MCAIHGFCWTEKGALQRMLDVAAHRGPDGLGLWGDKHVSLGHNLLAVTDAAEKSEQPWVTPRHVLTFNGEVYNYRQLRAEIGGGWRTDTDTEVLASGLELFGVEFLRRIDGMYALAWYDRLTHKLVLARDSNGAKPLYYARPNGRLAFSSEIRSLLALGLPRRVSRDGFRHYYHAGLVAGPLTLFDGVRRLVPGEVLEFDAATGRELNRLNLNDSPVPVYTRSPSELPGLIAERLARATRLTLGGRREVGLFLSGGMDSTAVLYEAVAAGASPRTFSTRFGLPHKNCLHNGDADVARELAKLYGTKHREVLVGEAEWVTDFEAAVAALEEPRQGKSYPAYLRTFRTAREDGAVVVLSGDGGDELLMGYKHQRLPSFRDKLAVLRPARALPDPRLTLPPDEQWAYLQGWLPKGRLTGDPVNDFMYTECLHTLAEDFLIRNDKLGAAYGMEARFPFMCRVFRDFVRGVPGHLKFDPTDAERWDLTNKKLMRAAYSGKLPPYVTQKPKTGWRAPTDDWIVGRKSLPAKDGPVRQFVRETLADPTVLDLFGLGEADVEGRYLNNRDFEGPPKKSGKPGAGPGLVSQKELFTVLAFATWLKTFNMRLW